ncbi:hypothetical protein XHV734_3203 [Xanthomonas hortorum pv. vitians]|nr:hypothetical protein XHV734_3203 [Xanthomonas hortorum pv. vitians]
MACTGDQVGRVTSRIVVAIQKNGAAHLQGVSAADTPSAFQPTIGLHGRCHAATIGYRRLRSHR